MTVAVTSLPVPLSPVTSTVLSLLPMMRKNSKTALIRALCPTTRESMETACGDVNAITSRNTQRSKVGHLLAKCSFDPDACSHVRARTARTHPDQSHDNQGLVDPYHQN